MSGYHPKGQHNLPCPGEEGFPADAPIAEACGGCPYLVILCSHHGLSGIDANSYSEQTARIAALEAEVAKTVAAHNDIFNQWEKASAEMARLKSMLEYAGRVLGLDLEYLAARWEGTSE